MIYRWSLHWFTKMSWSCHRVTFKLSTWSVGETELDSLNPKISEAHSHTARLAKIGQGLPRLFQSQMDGTWIPCDSIQETHSVCKDLQRTAQRTSKKIKRTSKNVATSDFLIPNLHRYRCLEISEKFLASPLSSSCRCLCFPRNPWASRLRLRRMAGCAHLAWPLAPCVTIYLEWWDSVRSSNLKLVGPGRSW